MGANDRPLAFVPVAEAMFRALALDRGPGRIELIARDGRLAKVWLHSDQPPLTRSEVDIVELHPRDDAG